MVLFFAYGLQEVLLLNFFVFNKRQNGAALPIININLGIKFSSEVYKTADKTTNLE